MLQRINKLLNFLWSALFLKRNWKETKLRNTSYIFTSSLTYIIRTSWRLNKTEPTQIRIHLLSWEQQLGTQIPLLFFFCFHTTNNNGKKNIGAEGCTAVHAEDFRKFLSQLTHFKGYAIEHVTAIFGEAPKISGEIRFFEKFEQVWKINFYGVMKIMDEVVPDFLIHKWSEVTAKQIMLNYESGKNKGNLAIVIIEMCAVAVSLKLFCELCYRLERGELLVLRGGVFNQIEEFLQKVIDP